MNEIEKYLKSMVDEQKILMPKINPIHGYRSLFDFVLRHGLSFTPSPRPKSIPLGAIKSCFQNAANLAMDHDLIYCEGYAAHLIPLSHAWCVDKHGKVIDNTWRTLAPEYFGIPFRTEYLRRSLLKNGCYGLIDAWWKGFPLLKDKPKLWLNDSLRQTARVVSGHNKRTDNNENAGRQVRSGSGNHEPANCERAKKANRV